MLPEGQRPELRQPTGEEVEAALEVAARHGWNEPDLAAAFRSDWPGIAAEPEALEGLLRDVVPHPGLTGTDQGRR